MDTMMCTWSSGLFCPKRQWWPRPAFEATAEGPFLRTRLEFANGIRYFSSGGQFGVRVANGSSKGKLNSVSDCRGVREDPDDGSDDSENEDDADFDDENEAMEENDLDYESDWEAEGNTEAAVDKADVFFTTKYEEDLVKGRTVAETRKTPLRNEALS